MSASNVHCLLFVSPYNSQVIAAFNSDCHICPRQSDKLNRLHASACRSHCCLKSTAKLHHVPLHVTPLLPAPPWQPFLFLNMLHMSHTTDAHRQLVLLPDLSSTVQTWNKMWPLMLTWLLTTLMTILAMTPLAAYHHWALVSMGAIVTAAFSTVGVTQYGLRPTGAPEDSKCPGCFMYPCHDSSV
jgi:hypothetical protein